MSKSLRFRCRRLKVINCSVWFLSINRLYGYVHSGDEAGKCQNALYVHGGFSNNGGLKSSLLVSLLCAAKSRCYKAVKSIKAALICITLGLFNCECRLLFGFSHI